jgi:hypothetical protein
MTGMTADIAARFMRIALGHVAREYPHKLDQVLNDDGDLLPPRVLHPVFFGSFDWHSCVHGWWLLLTLQRLYPARPEAQAVAALAATTFTPAKIAAECVYLERPGSAGFERPYGWAWLLYLHLEASRHPDSDIGDRLAPLARAFADRFKRYLDILTYPIRTGTHGNTTFALVLADAWAKAFDPALAEQIIRRARDWFGEDRDCQAWEPGGDEFLSSALVEALCMVRTQPAADARAWLSGFLPRIATRQPPALFTPATVSDRSDGKIAHLDGLNLSRAWCWRALLPLLGDDAVSVATNTIDAHLAAALPHVAGDYAGEHWLASFAALALLD